MTMPTDVQVSCIRKRDRLNPHERIEGLGGVHGGTRWYQLEDVIIAELEKPDGTRRWNYFTSVNGRTVRVIVAVHNGRKYLKTEADGYSPNNLLELSPCP
jgi:Protein of unknown function (DUF3892)